MHLTINERERQRRLRPLREYVYYTKMEKNCPETPNVGSSFTSLLLLLGLCTCAAVKSFDR